MDIKKDAIRFDFMGKRRVALVLSLALVVISVGALVTRGLNFGIEFTGGIVLEVAYPEAANLPDIRDKIASAGFERAIVQYFGSSRDVTIQLPPGDSADGSAVRDQLMEVLREAEPGIELRRVEFVGPQVGKELAEQGGLAMLFALIMILAYVAVRFQWKFAVGAVAALVHDVLIVLGFFAITHISVDLAVLAAVLAVIGYSLNDTIVVFDRIRENMLSIRKQTSEAIMNLSINQMIARTLVTSLTTLLVLVALLVLGGEAVYGFAVALIVGVVVGTYSSIFVASATALALDVTPQDLLPPQKDESELDSLP
jgi:preprotein translocase subunit SecF